MKYVQNDVMCHNKHSQYLMNGFIPNIAILSELCNMSRLLCITITHSCGILLLAQAPPKMPCIYTSMLFNE